MAFDEKAFHDVWGIAGTAPASEETGTRVLDPKQFEKQWFSEPASEKEPPDIGNNRAVGVNFLRGVSIVGAYADKAAAAINAAAQPVTSTPGMSDAPTFSARMTENERRIKAGTDKWAAEHPVESGIGQFAGGTAAMGPLATTAVGARALGLPGGLVQRAITGGLTGAAISGADSAARSNGDSDQMRAGAEVGGAIGALSPLAGRAIGAGVNKLMGPATDRATSYLLQRADDLGIPIRRSQSSTSPFINKMDQMVPKIP